MNNKNLTVKKTFDAAYQNHKKNLFKNAKTIKKR